MNDETRLDLERYLDGELPADRHAEVVRLLSGDGEAGVYLDRLSRLRTLARRHDRAMSQSVVAPAPRFREVGGRAIAAAILAACVAAPQAWRGHPAPGAPRARGAREVVVTARVGADAGRPSVDHEVALYTWANSAGRRPEAAAGALLMPRSRPGRRPAAVEILAIGLANADAKRAVKLEPLALVHRPLPGGRGKIEHHLHRARPITPGA